MELYTSISERLKELKEKKLNNKKKIVLLTTGALNPIHIGHLNILKIAADNLIKKGYEILCCFISPSSDDYLNDKKSWTKNFVYFPFELRLEMLKLAIKEYNNNPNNKKYNIRIHDWEGRQDGPWIDAPFVKQHIEEDIKKYFPKEEIYTYYVCGSDNYNKYKGMDGVDIVVINRKGEKIKYNNKGNRELFVFENDFETDEMNSTEIRNELMKNNIDNNIKEKVYKLIYPSVLDFAKNNVSKMII